MLEYIGHTHIQTHVHISIHAKTKLKPAVAMQNTGRAGVLFPTQVLASSAAWGRTSNLHENCMKKGRRTRGSTAQVRQGQLGICFPINTRYPFTLQLSRSADTRHIVQM